ncbi:MAG: hypothetical protein Q8P67_09645 [archaeon]|nr:hypothetical protein [archaeon]
MSLGLSLGHHQVEEVVSWSSDKVSLAHHVRESGLNDYQHSSDFEIRKKKKRREKKEKRRKKKEGV